MGRFFYKFNILLYHYTFLQKCERISLGSRGGSKVKSKGSSICRSKLSMSESIATGLLFMKIILDQSFFKDLMCLLASLLRSVIDIHCFVIIYMVSYKELNLVIVPRIIKSTYPPVYVCLFSPGLGIVHPHPQYCCLRSLCLRVRCTALVYHSFLAKSNHRNFDPCLS
jgi:hypothetical protein